MQAASDWKIFFVRVQKQVVAGCWFVDALILASSTCGMRIEWLHEELFW
jgi:hypothetical protein